MIPLVLRIKKVSHKEMAMAQDLVVESLYGVFNNAVLHGGTAIWRCYKGNRFSEDVDVYIKMDLKKLNALFTNLEKKGFTIEKKKITENNLFSVLRLAGITVRLEALFKKSSATLSEYETVEGNLITVYTLTAEELVKEKVFAYLKRSKVRDLYDIFFLLRYVKDKEKVVGDLKRLLNNFKKPDDEMELKVLIIEGLIPNVEKMLAYIKSFV